MKPNETKEKFLLMRADRHSYQDISEALEVSKTTLIEWGRTNQIELKNLMAVKMEHLCQQYSLTQEARIKFLGEHIGRVNSELSKRDLTNVSTEKLFDIILKLTEAQGKEKEAMSFFQEPLFGDISKRENWTA